MAQLIYPFPWMTTYFFKMTVCVNNTHNNMFIRIYYLPLSDIISPRLSLTMTTIIKKPLSMRQRPGA